MKADYTLQYLPDQAVDATLDQMLRSLLSTCFTGPEDDVFNHQRFFKEPPQHRWLVYDANQNLVGQTALHDKYMFTDQQAFRIGGVAEVCVLPEHRRQGLVKRLLTKIDGFLISQDIPFGVLFGREQYYASSGYQGVENIWFRNTQTDPWQQTPWGRVKNIKQKNWPEQPVYLDGPLF